MSGNLLVRRYPVDLEEGEGRTLFGRLVPYNEVTTVADYGVPYEEQFAPGAFAKDARLRKAPNRVELFYDHHYGLLDGVGLGVEFSEKDDGLYGTFRAYETPSGEQGLAMARTGVLRFFSVGFRSLRSRREAGVTVREGCRLDEVSLVREAAYKGTELAVRAAQVETFRPVRNADLDTRLAVLGFRVE